MPHLTLNAKLLEITRGPAAASCSFTVFQHGAQRNDRNYVLAASLINIYTITQTRLRATAFPETSATEYSTLETDAEISGNRFGKCENV